MRIRYVYSIIPLLESNFKIVEIYSSLIFKPKYQVLLEKNKAI